jgi:flagellar protein FlgJ
MLPVHGISLPASLSQPLLAQSGATVHDSAAAAAKLKSTAKEFEATFLSMLIKEMRSTLDEQEGLFPGDTGDVQGGLFDMFMGRHLAEGGGIGIAAYLQRHMAAANSAKSSTSTDAAAPAATTRTAHPDVPAATRR